MVFCHRSHTKCVDLFIPIFLWVWGHFVISLLHTHVYICACTLVDPSTCFTYYASRSAQRSSEGSVASLIHAYVLSLQIHPSPAPSDYYASRWPMQVYISTSNYPVIQRFRPPKINIKKIQALLEPTGNWIWVRFSGDHT